MESAKSMLKTMKVYKGIILMFLHDIEFYQKNTGPVLPTSKAFLCELSTFMKRLAHHIDSQIYIMQNRVWLLFGRCMYSAQRSTLDVCPQDVAYLVRTVSLFYLELTSLALLVDQQPQGASCLYLLSTMMTSSWHHILPLTRFQDQIELLMFARPALY